MSGGLPMTCYFSCWSGNDSLKFSKGEDKYGNTWTTPVMLDSGSTGFGLYCDKAQANGIPFICYRDQGNTTVKVIFAQDATGIKRIPPSVVDNGICCAVLCAEVTGHPAVAWCSSQSLKYAIYY